MVLIHEPRDFFSLTDEEITWYCTTVLDMAHVEKIEQYSGMHDSFVVTGTDKRGRKVGHQLENYDPFDPQVAADEEEILWYKYLLSRGVSWLLDDNPFLRRMDSPADAENVSTYADQGQGTDDDSID